MGRDMRWLAALLALGLACLACRGSLPPPAASAGAGGPLDAELAQFSRVEVPVDAAALSPGTAAAARRLIAAGALVERAFWQQSYRGGWELRTRLAGSADPLDRRRLELLLLNAGPFDRLRRQQPFYGRQPRPPGGGFYPEDLTAAELDAYLAAHPAEREGLLSPWTVVHRREGRLAAVPFHEEYAEWIEPLAAQVRQAAGLVEDPASAGYLRARAAALAADSYGESDRAFAAARGALLVTVGPQSTAYDQLKGVKQAYSMTVGIEDGAENRRIAAYLGHLDELERQLPLAERYRRQGARAPAAALEAVDDLFRAGAVAHGSLGSMVLPADPQARADGGRNVLWKNVIEARGAAIILPIARLLLAAGEERFVTPRAYFDFNLTHYVAHRLGPTVAEPAGRPVKELLGDVEGAIEETKAEIAGLEVLDWAISQGLLPPALGREHYATFIPHTFQTLSQGVQGLAPPQHDQGARLTLNWCRERGAIARDAASGRWRIDAERLPAALRELLAEILAIQATGDRARALRLLGRYAVLGPDLQAAAERVAAARPASIEPVFRIRWR